MDESIKSRCMKRFKDHKATVVLEDKNFLILDWRDKSGSGEYAVRYIVDCQKGNLIVSGDLGDCIASWFNNVTPDKLACYVNDISYFMGKFQCSSDTYDYQWRDIVSDLEGIKEEFLKDDGNWNHGISEDEVEEDFAEMIRLCDEMTFGENVPYPDAFVELVEKYADPWWESEFAHIGKRISGRVYLWAVGYQMALKQIRETAGDAGKAGANGANQPMLIPGA
jgi:hypothetical protein